MKVKVGNKIYDGKEEPVMVILEGNDKQNIENMLPECTKYAMFPDGLMDEDEMRAWMKVPEGDDNVGSE